MLQLINQTNVTIIYLHHNRKMQKGESYSMSSSRGSTELMAKVSSHLIMEYKKIAEECCFIEDNEIYAYRMTIEQKKNRLPESIDKIAIKFSFDKKKNVTTIKYEGEFDEKKKMTEVAKEKLLEVFQKEPKNEFTYKELNDDKLSGENNLRIALKEMVSENQITLRKGKSNTYYYKLAEDIGELEQKKVDF